MVNRRLNTLLLIACATVQTIVPSSGLARAEGLEVLAPGLPMLEAALGSPAENW